MKQEKINLRTCRVHDNMDVYADVHAPNPP
jgi:hypothetical protein